MRPYTQEAAEADLAAALAHGDEASAVQAAQHLDRLPPPEPASLLGAALWYADHQLPVFPVQPLSKVPYPGTRGVHDATTDPNRIRAWWTSGPGYAESNVGLATGHLVDVIDFDGPEAHAAWGVEYPDGWEQAEVVVLATVSTPRPGGLHVYVPANGSGNRANIVPGVDYRGLGGYVLAPPSRLDSRDKQHPGSYRFLRPLHPEELL